MTKREIFGVLAVVIVGLAITVSVLLREKQTVASADSHDHGAGCDHQHEGTNGKHGGKMLAEDDFELELVISEGAKNSHFRIYPFYKHKPIDPSQVTVSVETELLDSSVRKYSFSPVDDFLLSAQEIEDPKSFFINVSCMS